MVIWITLLNHPNEVWNPYLREVSELNFRVLHRSTLIHFMLELRAPTRVSSLKSIRKLSDFNDRMLLLVDSTDTYIIFMWFCVDLKKSTKMSKNYQKNGKFDSVSRIFTIFNLFPQFLTFFQIIIQKPQNHIFGQIEVQNTSKSLKESISEGLGCMRARSEAWIWCPDSTKNGFFSVKNDVKGPFKGPFRQQVLTKCWPKFYFRKECKK